MTSHEPVNILLVDDQPAKLLSYETVLAELGENLIRANSGKEALEILLKNEIAVVLVDVCMPELDGFELAALIRNHPRFKKTAIILVSGVLVEDVDKLKGYVSGAVDYVSVPIVPEILRAKVSVFVELYRKTQALQHLNQELEERVAERTAEIAASAARLLASEERLRLVLTASGIQGWTWDIPHNEISWVMPSDEARSSRQPLADFLTTVHPQDRGVILEAFERAVRGGTEYYAEFRTAVAGEEEWWLGRGTVLRDSSGQPHSIAGINTNITARKHAEEERTVLLRNAEEARREAEKANRLKDEFLATVSHELRTPLNAITGWAHMLKVGGLDSATQTKGVETIHRNALLQGQLISDLLDVSRIVSGKLRLELKSVDLPSIMQAALDTIRPAAEAKDIQIQVAGLDEMEHIHGDPARLQQVIGNLLSNATKFAPPKGHVQISLQKLDSEVELTVQDDGPGIPPATLPYIFERFRQGDSSSTREHQGLGLGLAIARHLVEMHGGHLHAFNREDRSGAIFKAVLPCQPSSVEALAGAGKVPMTSPESLARLDSATALKNLRVLVVDDEPDAREVVALVLERSGAEVLVAASAGDAFLVLERELPDVLVADIEMPGEDGYSLLRRIRALPPERGGETPAIALTAYGSTQDRIRALNAGFHIHVPKPVQPPELIAIVATLAGSNRRNKSQIGRRHDSPRGGARSLNRLRARVGPASAET